MGQDRRRRWSLRFTLATVLIGLLLAGLGGVVGVVLLIRARSVEATSRAIQREVLARLTENFRAALEPAEGIVRTCADEARLGFLSTDDLPRLARGLCERIRYDPRYEWLGFLKPDGSGAAALRLPDGGLALLYPGAPGADGRPSFVTRILGPDGALGPPEPRPAFAAALAGVAWYEAGAGAEGPAWTDRYQRPFDAQWGRACAMALRREGALEGVFGVGFGEQFVSMNLEALRVAETGRVFLLSPVTGRIVLAPTPEVRERLGPVVEEVVGRVEGGVAALAPGRPFHGSAARDGTDYAVVLERQVVNPSLAWVNAVVVPEEELVGYLGRYMRAGLLGVLVLFVLSVLLAQWVASRVSRPLRAIAEDLGRVGEFDLRPVPPPSCRIQEVGVLAQATERMKASLLSFGRYVPTALVRDLLHRGQEARLGGRTRPLTLFFSDVKGFTTLSEGMAPQRLVENLGAYLDVVSGTLARHQGTIDKYMGDGVLAFFNAPHDDPRHAANACRAALAVQRTLAERQPQWTAEGRPPFLTRIGLHSGDVVVGNIGTPERFAYTVIGDGVNLASRLESLNKVYGTWILASDATRAAAGEGFEWRTVDRAAVAGRAGGADLHELLGETGAVDPVLLRARDRYEEALRLHLARRFDEAAAAFEDALRLRPGDGAAPVLLDRARSFARTPPPPDWTGVHVHTAK